MRASPVRKSANRFVVLMLASVVVGAGCQKAGQSAAEAPASAPDNDQRSFIEPPAQGLRNRNGSQLAYEQEIQVRLEAGQIAGNLAATRDACMAQRFGACSVDLFAITERLAQLEAELGTAEQQAAQQQRRINTNLLTIKFESTDITVASSRVGQALRGMTSVWDVTIATLITVVGALLPVGLLVGLLWWLVRAFRRRFPGRS